MQDWIYPVLLDGWDQQSIWGWDSGMSCYFAQLTRNGNSDDNGPDVWITPPAWPAMQLPDTLAQAIARATGADLATVSAAMNDSLDEDGKIHRILDGNRR
ncbi:hypothetical protein [Actinoplanes sp. N902-109]|uniref:hypothetical protein n=1 Tax=Actinoplanes sp. (strain N902-109) TaxID=649831 RepID=UPI0003294014|nr:hypothetical protein [Actinoplanes sp. N902-109]AGL15149.1 hypothetical protein L083_1639 [Actinoplanes sp. N902-109]